MYFLKLLEKICKKIKKFNFILILKYPNIKSYIKKNVIADIEKSNEILFKSFTIIKERYRKNNESRFKIITEIQENQRKLIESQQLELISLRKNFELQEIKSEYKKVLMERFKSFDNKTLNSWRKSKINFIHEFKDSEGKFAFNILIKSGEY